jgi:hypothetical protein
MNDIASIRKSVFPSCRGTRFGFALAGESVRGAVSVWTAEALLEVGKK